MKKTYLRLLVIASIMLLSAMAPRKLSAQAPTLSYGSPQTYPVGVTITPLTPASSGVGAFTTNSTVLATGFVVPYAVAVDDTGNVYVADKGNSAIMKIRFNGGAPVTAATGFSVPTGVAIDASGNLFVCESGTHRLTKIPHGTNTHVPFGGGLVSPYGVTVDKAGNVYVADIGNASGGSITKLDPNGNVMFQVLGSFAPKSIAVDGSGNMYFVSNNQLFAMAPGGLANLWSLVDGFVGVASDAAGNVYVSGTNYKVSEIIAGTTTLAVVATGFNFPAGLAIGASGTVYVAEYGNATVDKITTPTGGYYIKPGLSPNLTFNNTTGTISGSPGLASAATNYTVTAYNATGSTSANVSITVNGSTDLRNLAVSAGALSPAFAQTTTSYTATVDNTNTSVQVTPTAFDPVATITINGAAILSGRASAFIPLSATNPTTITIVVAKPGLATKTYTIAVTRAAPIISYSTPHSYVAGTPITPLAPTGTIGTASGYSDSGTTFEYFQTNNLGYTAFDAAGNLYVTDFAAGTVRKIAPGSTTAVVIASGLSQPLGIVVDASNNVYVADAAHNAVKEILATDGSIVSVGSGFGFPVALAFDKAGNLYVTNSDNGVINKLSADHTTMSVVGTGFTNPWGVAIDASNNILVTDSNNGLYKITPAGVQTTLATDLNNPNALTLDAAGNIYVTNTSDGNIKEYPAGGGAPIIIGNPIIWAPFGIVIGPDGSLFVSSNRNIVVLKPLGGALISPALPAGLSFNKTTGVITGTPTAVSAAKNYTVTAFNSTGSSKATVNIAVTTSNNADLSNLTLSVGTLTPVFAAATTSYKATVSNATASLKISPTVANSTATVKVNGVAVSSGAASASLPLAVGENTINIVVTAPNGTTTKTYTLTVTRISNNAGLSALNLSSGTLSPAFATATTSYTASVPYATTSVTVTPTAVNSKATIKVNGVAVASGSPSGAIALNAGANTITIVATSQDGTATKTYTILVSRLSNTATLKSLVLSSGTLSPAFGASTIHYSASVSNSTASITITPTAVNSKATIIINGAAVASGEVSASIPLIAGNNTITTVVTSQDSTASKTYTLVVTRLSNNATLAKLALSSGTLSPAFAAGTKSYTASVSNATASIKVTPTVANSNATIKVNGATVASGAASASLPLTVGANTITTIVTAQDGTTKTYTINITRASGSLNTLYLPGSGEQTPFTSSFGAKVEANNILSPNGDGINDMWVVKNIAFYPDNTVTVYDKAGGVVFTRKGYANDWNGAYRGSVLSEGTYYYLVDLGNGSTLKGFITVMGR